MMQYILAIDLGTSGPKAAIFSMEGELICSEFQETKLLLKPDGGAEQDPAEWWEAIEVAVIRLLAKGRVPPGDIRGIATTGQWSGTVAVGRDGRPLSHAIIWMDSRGARGVRQVMKGAMKLSGYPLAKLVRWLRLSGGLPGNAGKDPLAHILYIKDCLPDLYRRTWKFLEPIDYIGLKLTGTTAASFNSIALHWLTDNRDISHIAYDDGLIKLSGVDREKLPELRPPNALLGPLSPAIARAWGLAPDTPVFMGSPDVHSAAVGSGAVADFDAHLYIGTSSWLTCHVPFKKTDIFHNLASLPSGIPGRYLLTNEQECAGINLQYLRDNVFFHNDELSTARPADAYRLFDRIAARTPAGSGSLIFTPWLYGERAPVDDRFVRGGFFNQSLHTTRAHMVRAVYEGVAYNSRWLLKYVERFIGRPAAVINVVGGGARSDIWCQILADVFDRRIRQMEHPVEANVRGAALLASAALGHLRYDEIGSHVPVARTYEPDPGNRGIYDKLFDEFVSIYWGNRKAYARLNRA
jgi:xylulokinase